LLDTSRTAVLYDAGSIAGRAIGQQQVAIFEHGQFGMDAADGVVGDGDVAVLIATYGVLSPLGPDYG
jgi:hypothetical protein